MPSPFPGMNPYLEQPDGWHEFHETYCGVIIETLIAAVPDTYLVRGEENVYIRELSASERGLVGRPDVHVAARPASTESRSGARASETTAAAHRLSFPAVDRYTETTVVIVDQSDRRVITAIELLSPSNKEGGNDRASYLKKRMRYVSAGTNLVEIDLLRGGQRPTMEPPIPESDYCVVVGRADDRPAADVWSITLRERLPVVPIPLRAGEDPVPLDLQSMLHIAFDRRRFDRFIYDNQPRPALSEADAVWAREIIAASQPR
jgi:hypothetical protein